MCLACADGTWGLACNEICNCHSVCDKLTGVCPTKCKYPFIDAAASCQISRSFLYRYAVCVFSPYIFLFTNIAEGPPTLSPISNHAVAVSINGITVTTTINVPPAAAECTAAKEEIAKQVANALGIPGKWHLVIPLFKIRMFF